MTTTSLVILGKPLEKNCLNLFDNNFYQATILHLRDRSYYGISHEFQSVSASSDLVTGRTFYINYTYGSESDLHTGKFILDGARVNSTTPIHGHGNFVQMGRKMDLKEPQVEADFTAVYVTEDGYLRYNSMGSTHSRSLFEQLVAENLDAGEEDEEELKQAMNEGIRVFVGGSAVHDAMWDYFRELLDATPIEEIIGEPLPPQVKVAPRSVSKRGSVAKQVTDLPDGRQFLQTKSV